MNEAIFIVKRAWARNMSVIREVGDASRAGWLMITGKQEREVKVKCWAISYPHRTFTVKKATNN